MIIDCVHKNPTEREEKEDQCQFALFLPTPICIYNRRNRASNMLCSSEFYKENIATPPTHLN
jgi:hypothetical protein